MLGVLGTTKVEAKPKARPVVVHEKDHVKRMTYHDLPIYTYKKNCDIIDFIDMIRLYNQPMNMLQDITTSYNIYINIKPL